MDKGDLEEYLKKLESFEKQLSGDETEVDDDFINEVNKVLGSLNDDAISHVSHTPQPTIENLLNCKLKRLHPNAVIPKYAKDGDAGMDLYATDMVLDELNKQVTYNTGIAMEIPQGFVGLVFPRSSIRKTCLSLSNSVGVIDSGYRGEIIATFNITNSNNTEIYNVGDRICQILILPYPKIAFTEVDELTETDRGEGGFGSTGK